MHQSGLKSWIPFYLETIENGTPRYDDMYSRTPSKKYPIPVAENLYISKAYSDSLMQIIIHTELDSAGKYLYSDLGFYFMKAIIEKVSGETLEDYVARNFYEPMGMTTTGYLPLERFSLSQIIPTEEDDYFRNRLIQGYVHDPGAAMLGGVGGHAGVFSDAEDLAKLWQMYLNKGQYGGRRYISEKTIRAFTKCQNCIGGIAIGNRRGLGFDKPVRDGEGGPTCSCVSFDSFGHTGFTGTIAWADPNEDIIYIFLSNRTYPTSRNKKLITMNVRTDIMEIIYGAIQDPSYRIPGIWN